MADKRLKISVRRSLVLFSLPFLIIALAGCDAFVRKFTRKPKKEDLPREELVLEPQEYKSDMTKEELYRQYLLYWKSWQGELIESLSAGQNYKKQVGSLEQAMKNLAQLRQMLDTKLQQKLDVYIAQLQDLREAVTQDIYGANRASNRLTAERIKMRILRDFSYNRIKDSLI